MARVIATDQALLFPPLGVPERHFARGFFAIVFVTIVVVVAVYQMRPPAAVLASAPAADFSSDRAMKQLRPITVTPHPMGSVPHTRVREYLLQQLTALGLKPEVHRAEMLDPKIDAAATVYNVVARLKGTDNSKAIMLVGHYDSVPTSFGASDDGSAVVAILEVLRAIQVSAPLKNDVICLLSDGEEAGSLGAKAFAESDPWAKDVGLVLNFEARGNGGGSVMFESSDQNGWLIRGLAKSGVKVLTNSFLQEIYKAMPNDTDLTVFKQAGYSGLNFAFINGHTHYHSLTDNFEQIDERSLQHQGSYALTLTRYFGNVSLEGQQERNAVYFDVLGAKVISYSEIWVVPITALILLLFIAVVVIGYRRGRWNLSGITYGFLAILLAMIATSGGAILIWTIVSKIHPTYKLLLQGVTYNASLYAIAFILLSVSIFASLLLAFLKKISVGDLTVGGLLWWVLLLVLATIHLPGASYLFAWPLLFTLLGLLPFLLPKQRQTTSGKEVATRAVCAVPGIILFIPVIYLLLQALPTSAMAAVMFLVVLLLTFLVPQIHLMASWKKWSLPVAAAAASLIFFFAGSFTAGFDRAHPRPENLFYCLNADDNTAVWASTDEKPDEWTNQFLRPGYQNGVLPQYLPPSEGDFLNSPAPVVSLSAPTVALLEEKLSNGRRSLRLRVVSPRLAPFISVQVEQGANIFGATVNQKRLELNEGKSRPRLFVAYYAPPAEGFELTLETEPARPVTIRVVDHSFELPKKLLDSAQPRPDYVTPTPYPYNPFGDSTFVSKNYTF